MKSLCCIGLCFLLIGNGIAQEWGYLTDLPDDVVKTMTEGYKNPKWLKESLMGYFAGDHILWPEEIPLFMKKFDVSEDTLRTALMGIILEAAEITKWAPLRHDMQDELLSEKRRLMNAIRWLRFCADESAKEFLMEIAIDETKGEVYRNMAVGAYIKSADARQVKDGLIRFLTEKRVVVHSTYLYASVAYKEAGDDAAKRAAIVEALTAAALVREEDRGHFAAADKEFAEVDAEYAKSPRRQAALQLLGLQPEKKSFLKSLWR